MVLETIIFCRKSHNYIYFSSDKTIKLWKIGQKRRQYSPKAVDAFHNNGRLELPQLDCDNSAPPSSSVCALQAYTRRTYSNAHTYHINSLALNSDGESFVSADDLRINWWNLNNSETCFSKFSFFLLLFFVLIDHLSLCFLCRHHRYQTRKHGGADGGHHCGSVSPSALQHLGIQLVAGRY